MMLFKKKNKTDPKKASAPLTRDLEIGEQAFKDWPYLLVGFAILVALTVVVDGFLFIKVNRGDFFTVEPDQKINVASSNREALLDVNEFFSARQKEYEEFVSSGVNEIDPSI